MPKIKVLVIGAAGKMGLEVVRAVVKDSELILVGAVDKQKIGCDIGEVAGMSPLGICISEDLTKTIREVRPDVAVDFTNPTVLMDNLCTVFKYGIAMVVGTTGLVESDIHQIEELAAQNANKAIIAPNFAIGAILMMRFAELAAKYFPKVEIIELHHEQKIDAPSGTAIKTAELIHRIQGHQSENNSDEFEKIRGARGGELGGIHIHSIRLPGLVAHQEVIFGGLGQTLTIRHDSLSRESFMPGVILAIKKVNEIEGVVYGLEKLI